MLYAVCILIPLILIYLVYLGLVPAFEHVLAISGFAIFPVTIFFDTIYISLICLTISTLFFYLGSLLYFFYTTQKIDFKSLLPYSMGYFFFLTVFCIPKAIYTLLA
jgi:hypothetical protein